MIPDPNHAQYYKLLKLMLTRSSLTALPTKSPKFASAISFRFECRRLIRRILWERKRNGLLIENLWLGTCYWIIIIVIECEVMMAGASLHRAYKVCWYICLLTLDISRHQQLYWLYSTKLLRSVCQSSWATQPEKGICRWIWYSASSEPNQK